MTVNEIRNEGAKTLSEMLKVNTTLASLDLWREEERVGVGGRKMKDKE